MKYGKKYAESVKSFDGTKLYEIEEAVEIVLNTAKAKLEDVLKIPVDLVVVNENSVNDVVVNSAPVVENNTLYIENNTSLLFAIDQSSAFYFF